MVNGPTDHYIGQAEGGALRLELCPEIPLMRATCASALLLLSIAAAGCDQATGGAAPGSAIASQPDAEAVIDSALADEAPASGETPTDAQTIQPPPVEIQNTQLSSVAADAGDEPTIGTRTPGVDWPVFLGPSGNSKSSESGILKEWPATGPKLVWQRPLGEGYGAPTISRGRLFQFDRFGDKARLYCLNAETGQPLWQHEVTTEYEDMYGYNNGPRCSPVVDGDRVYAYGVDGMLLCCRVTDGEPLWQVDTAKQYGVIQNFFGVGSTPVVEGNLLIAMVGGSPPESQNVAPGDLRRVAPSGTAIVAFDKRTGEEKYRLGDDLASYASLKLATIDNRRWCFAFCREGLLGFEPASGKLDFHYPWRAPNLESVNASMPVVAGNQVFISETYGPGSTLLAVSPGKSNVVWQDSERRRARAMQTHWNTPIYLDGFLYASSGRHSENAELRCIEWQTGKIRWSVPGMSRCSLTYIDGHFLCLGEYGQLWLLKANPDKYEQVATVDYADAAVGEKLLGESGPALKHYCWAAPIVSHGLLYIRGDDRLLCLELIPK
jgi:outer membrane protein assembly factor BamB